MNLAYKIAFGINKCISNKKKCNSIGKSMFFFLDLHQQMTDDFFTVIGIIVRK